jgi:hypothetical protein
VNFSGSANLVGQMIELRIEQALPHSLRGRLTATLGAAVAHCHQ